MEITDHGGARPSWDDYFLDIARLVSTRSTCPRASVGAVVVHENRILGTGYNGAASGSPHCLDSGCVLEDGHCIRAIHAEINAILDALLRGPVRGSSLYCTHQPCVHCSKLIRQVGIERVIYANPYPRSEQAEIVVNELDIESISVLGSNR